MLGIPGSFFFFRNMNLKKNTYISGKDWYLSKKYGRSCLVKTEL